MFRGLLKSRQWSKRLCLRRLMVTGSRQQQQQPRILLQLGGNGNGDRYDPKGRIKRGVLVTMGTGTLVLGLYVYLQIRWKQKMGEKDNNTIFVPLWINPNWIYRSAYKFPKTVQYFDCEFFKYLEQEIEQVSEETELEPLGNPSLTTHIHNYYMGEEALKFMQVFVNTNVKYKVLEELLKNTTIRRLFGLPLSIDLIDYRRENFRVWVESKYPTISGVEIPMDDWKSWKWVINPINWHTLANNLASEWTLNRENANSVDENDDGSHRASLDSSLGSRNYSIVYTGEFLVRDHQLETESWLYYKGVIDFNHLLINRGVQLIELDLIIKQNNELVKYKII